MNLISFLNVWHVHMNVKLFFSVGWMFRVQYKRLLQLYLFFSYFISDAKLNLARKHFRQKQNNNGVRWIRRRTLERFINVESNIKMYFCFRRAPYLSTRGLCGRKSFYRLFDVTRAEPALRLKRKQWVKAPGTVCPLNNICFQISSCPVAGNSTPGTCPTRDEGVVVTGYN